jgi:hypothetical protein
MHPELTGRENVYLMGAVLGLRRSAVRKRFDEIVSFAGVEHFLDTPVKRYSSGMRLRLAFATAVHIEPPIIVVDEVLTVGDAAFREKCLEKLSEIGRHGRTVLYVSHDLGSITRLCPRAIWLEKGQIHADGPATEVVGSYLHRGDAGAPLFAEFDEEEDLPCALTSVAIRSLDGKLLSHPSRDQSFVVDIGIRVREPTPELDIAIRLVNEGGARVIDDGWSDTNPDVGLGEEPGDYHVTAQVPPLLSPRRYTLGVWIGNSYRELLDREALTLDVAPRIDDRTEMIERPRIVQPPVTWSVQSSR